MPASFTHPATDPALPYDDRRSAGRVLADVVAARLRLSPAGAGGREEENPAEPRYADGPRDQGDHERPVVPEGTAHPVDGIVLGLPRGGVVVAAAVAVRLGWSLDVVVVRKLGVPWHPELAMGAIGPGGVRVVDDGLVRRLGVSADEVERVVATERVELQRRERRYRGSRPPLEVAGKLVVVVDDGLATGSTARAACHTLRRLEARHIVLAVPVGPAESVAALRADADDVVCAAVPRRFQAVGEWYRDFRETTDREVVELLGATWRPLRSST